MFDEAAEIEWWESKAPFPIRREGRLVFQETGKRRCSVGRLLVGQRAGLLLGVGLFE
jgi:hypothetical protein